MPSVRCRWHRRSQPKMALARAARGHHLLLTSSWKAVKWSGPNGGWCDDGCSCVLEPRWLPRHRSTSTATRKRGLTSRPTSTSSIIRFCAGGSRGIVSARHFGSHRVVVLRNSEHEVGSSGCEEACLVAASSPNYRRSPPHHLPRNLTVSTVVQQTPSSAPLARGRDRLGRGEACDDNAVVTGDENGDDDGAGSG